jgi:hypothetical protein
VWSCLLHLPPVHVQEANRRLQEDDSSDSSSDRWCGDDISDEFLTSTEAFQQKLQKQEEARRWRATRSLLRNLTPENLPWVSMALSCTAAATLASFAHLGFGKPCVMLWAGSKHASRSAQSTKWSHVLYCCYLLAREAGNHSALGCHEIQTALTQAAALWHTC